MVIITVLPTKDYSNITNITFVNINYVKHKDINFKKWDKCIKKAINGSLYGYSWFLDVVSPGWDALIDESYENVMPLTHKKLFWIKILIQPHFATNLGVYSSYVLDSETVNRFISAIPPQFKYTRINLNKYNKLSIKDIRIKRDIHYELDLIRPYRLIQEHYGPEVKHNLTVVRQKVYIIPGLNSNDLIHLYKNSKGWLWSLFHRDKIKILKILVSTAVHYRVGQVFGAYIDNILCATAFFIFSHEKATLLFLGLNHTSLKEHALEAIIDEFIKLHSEQNLTLRFEFASRKKFASIYTGFGGRSNQFMNIRQNRLPCFLKLIRL
jgi:hypothetical protein